MKTFAAFVGEIRTFSTDNDADRFEARITRLRGGLQDLLATDDALDDQVLASMGIAASDKQRAEPIRFSTDDDEPVSEDRHRKGSR